MQHVCSTVRQIFYSFCFLLNSLGLEPRRLNYLVVNTTGVFCFFFRFFVLVFLMYTNYAQTSVEISTNEKLSKRHVLYCYNIIYNTRTPARAAVFYVYTYMYKQYVIRPTQPCYYCYSENTTKLRYRAYLPVH